MIIGISGRAGVGKDTLADRLVTKHGYVKYSMAYPMKKLLNDRFGWSMSDWDNRVWKEASDGKNGWNEITKVPFSPRSWAQWVGTEVMRNMAGEDVWVKLMEKEYLRLCVLCGAMADRGKVVTPKMVVPDIRFDNEARAIDNFGGIVLRLERPAAAAVEAHVSEAGISKHYLTHTFINHGSKDELFSVVEKALGL